MKVKNIVFSGFMAAILSATGANAAISVASKAYVDKYVGDNGSVTTELAKKANTADVEATYATKAFVGSLEGKDAATIVEYIDEKTADIASGTAFSELTGRVGTAEGKITALETLTGAEGQIAKDIAQALSDAKADATTKANAAQAAAEETAQGYVDALDGELAAVAKTGAYSDLTGVPVVDAEFSATSSNAATSSAIATYVGKVKDELSNGVAREVETIQEDITEIETTIGTVEDGKTVVEMIADAKTAASTGASEALEAYKTTNNAAVKAADDKAVAAQGEVDALEIVVGNNKTATDTAIENITKTGGTIDTKVAASAAATKTAYEAADTNLETSLKTYADDKASTEAKKEAKAVADTLKFLATAEVPDECLTGADGSNMCVLTLTSTGTFAWTPLTTPVE